MHRRESCAGHSFFGLLATSLAMQVSLFFEGRVNSSFYVNCIKMSFFPLLTWYFILQNRRLCFSIFLLILKCKFEVLVM